MATMFCITRIKSQPIARKVLCYRYFRGAKGDNCKLRKSLTGCFGFFVFEPLCLPLAPGKWMHQLKTVRRHLWLVFFFGLGLGCSNSGIPSATVESSQAKFDQAQSLVSIKDYAGALPLLDEAISKGGLDADFALSSLVMRAKCNIELGKLPEALADIESAAVGADDLSVIHGLRYSYWLKAGDPSKAQAELQMARQLNPQFSVP
jgi:tetratricopeptide (TPR) repeat protein